MAVWLKIVQIQVRSKFGNSFVFVVRLLMTPLVLREDSIVQQDQEMVRSRTTVSRGGDTETRQLKKAARKK